MEKIMVLGGAGAVGSVAARTLASKAYFSHIVIGDINVEQAEEIAGEMQSPIVSVQKVDVMDPDGLRDAIRDCSVVLNCSGPFYRFAVPVLEAVIDTGVNYVDICDDVDVTLDVLRMDGAAIRSNVKALIGMGSSPGVTNLLAAFAADTLLDRTDSIDIFHAHGGEPVEGEGVIAHRFHCMSIEIPMFLDGKRTYVKYFSDEGRALRQTFKFPVVGEVPLYPYPHPEQVTLPNHIRCKQVTNKGTVLPGEYYDLIKDICRLGLHSREPLDVGGRKIAPYDVSVAFLLKERERILKETEFGPQRGCVSIIVKGMRHREYREYRFHLASLSQALGEGTGIPAAIGAILMQTGRVRGKGVMPPEACVDPADFLAMVPEVMKLDKEKEGGKTFGGVVIEQVDEEGNVTKLDM
ncbi:MAG: saccharopine dehydrogenase NADP-binding domain-containing protein [Pseudomonadota bacterium]